MKQRGGEGKMERRGKDGEEQGEGKIWQKGKDGEEKGRWRGGKGKTEEKVMERQTCIKYFSDR